MTQQIALVFLFSGLLALWIGGEGIVRATMSFARMMGVGVFAVSLTLLAAATTSPELFYNVISAIEGESVLGLGNVVGSNITNFALIFAIATLFFPLKKKDEEAIWAYPALIGISLFFLLLGVDGVINRFEGVLLICLFVAWMFMALRGDHKKRLLEKIKDIIPQHKERSHKVFTTTIFVLSLILLAGGAELLVKSIQGFSTTWGMSPFLLSALLVALGTSLPELATVVVAVFRKRDDIRSGTLFGSNIFNLTLIIGVTAVIQPIHFSSANFTFLGVLLTLTVMLAAPIIFNFRFSSRMWSTLLLVVYGYFIVYTTSQLIF